MPPDAALADLPRAIIRDRPEDFQVVEVAAYPPTGQGDHLFVTFRKRGLTTPQAVERLARALGADPREAGFAGMKDRHAITTQTASFALPPDRDPEALLAAATLDDIELLALSRHPHKLRAGHLAGNRFTLTLRDLDRSAQAAVGARLERIARHGLPNAFGPQRFGRHGDNAERALRWIAGSGRPTGDRRRRRLLASALQSQLFNALLDERLADESWRGVIGGDLVKKHDSGGMFTAPDDGPELTEVQRRAAAGELSATGPMFGRKMRWPTGQAAQRERALLDRHIEPARQARALGRMGKGTRRPLRLWVTEVDWSTGTPDRSMTLRFRLPKGGYATTVLAAICHPVQAEGQQPGCTAGPPA